MFDIEKVKEIPIEDVCSSYGIQLKQKGQNLWGNIRNEKTPSFSINPQKNIWRDWGMSEGGSVIDLVVKMENVDVGKAINILGERFGLINEEPSLNETKTLPSKNQFERIGVISERVMSNFDLNFEKQSMEKLEELDEKYSGTMTELSSENPKLYHKIIDRKAIPIIFEARNLLFQNLNLYKNTNDTIMKDFLKSEIQDLKNDLNTKVDIYNRARVDGATKDNLKIKIDDSLLSIMDTPIPTEPFRYYLTQRPPSIGTHPRGTMNMESFDTKQIFEGVNCWGYVEYEKALTTNQISNYELTERTNENLKDIENFITTKNVILDDGSKIRKGTSFKVEGENDNGYDVHFEMNNKNKYTNDTAEYVLSKSQILDFAKPDIEINDNKNVYEYESNIYLEREIDEIMEEVKKEPLIDMKVDKDVDVTEIMENLKNGVGNIFNNQNFVEYLNFQSNFHNYSPNNNLLIAFQNPHATNVASFTRWKALGRNVNKGEKGIMILAPNVTKNGVKEIMERLDKYKKTNVGKYTFDRHNTTYNVYQNNKPVSTMLSKRELESFIKVNNLSQTSMIGFKKTYVFDISQTNGKDIPKFKIELKDTQLLDNNGYYKNPLIKVSLSEGSIFKENQVLTFKQANEIFKEKERETRELKQQFESKGEYYPYLKQKFDVILKPSSPLDGVAKDIRVDIGDGQYNNLLEALKGEMKGYPQVFSTLEETLISNDTSMETILGIKHQLENTIKEKGLALEYINDTGNAKGFYSPMENKICVNSELGLSQTTKTLVHEYVHSQLHSTGLESKDNLQARQVAEIEAEGSAYVISKHFGFDTSEYSFDYVSTWARGKEVAELQDTLKTIKATSEKIINEIKSPLELELYNNRTNIEAILKAENIKPNDNIINNMIDINKETGKINNLSDLSNAQKFKTYEKNPELSNKIIDTNKELSENIIKVEVKKEIVMER